MSDESRELNSGLLVMGMSNTVFFGEGVVHELVLVDLSTGQDFSMPITEEQATFLAHMATESSNIPQTETAQGGMSAAENSAWQDPDSTPQL